MAQISTPKAFEKALLDEKTLKGLEPFVDFTNHNFDQLIRALFKQLTLKDNFHGRLQTLTALHNEALTLETSGQAVLSVLPLKVTDDAVRSVSFYRRSDGTLSMTLRFEGPIPVKTRAVTVSGSLATYEVKASAFIEAGDKVSISGYGHKANNGTFLVAHKGQTSIVVVNPDAAAESPVDYVGAGEVARSVLAYVFYE